MTILYSPYSIVPIVSVSDSDIFDSFYYEYYDHVLQISMESNYEVPKSEKDIPTGNKCFVTRAPRVVDPTKDARYVFVNCQVLNGPSQLKLIL